MPKWELLQVVTLVLINTVQAERVNSIEQHDHTLNWKDIFLGPMKYDNELFIQENVPQTTCLRSHFYNPEHQSNDKESLQTEPSMGSIELRSPIQTSYVPKNNEIEECLKNNVYCDELKSYPGEKILESFDKKNAIMNMSLLPNDGIFILMTETKFNPVCAKPPLKVYPKAAQLLKTEEWRYIVQLSSFKQGIEIMPCSNHEETLRACSSFREKPLCCKQEYTLIKLVTINSTGVISYEQFNFPFICRCVKS